MIKLDGNEWKTFEMLCLSKTWTKVHSSSRHSGRAI